MIQLGDITGHPQKKDAGGTMDIPGPLQFPGNRVQCLVPCDLLEPALPSLTHSLHGMQESVRMVDSLTMRAPPKTAPELRLGAVIALNASDHPVPNMDFESAGSAAVAGARGIDNFVSIRVCQPSVLRMYLVAVVGPLVQQETLAGTGFGLNTTEGSTSA